MQIRRTVSPAFIIQRVRRTRLKILDEIIFSAQVFFLSYTLYNKNTRTYENGIVLVDSENEAFQKYQAETVSANSNEVRSAHTHTLSLSPFQLAMNGLSRLNYKVPK